MIDFFKEKFREFCGTKNYLHALTNALFLHTIRLRTECFNVQLALLVLYAGDNQHNIISTKQQLLNFKS